MSKPEWGTKRLCQACGAKFYDLQRAPIICPKCGVEADREGPLKSRRSRGAAPKPAEAPKKPAKPVKAETDGEDSEELPEADLADAELPEADLDDDVSDDNDDDLIEDTSELGDDDMGDVVAGKDEDET